MNKELGQLRQQVQDTENLVQTQLHPLGNPNVGSVFEMTLDEIKSRYPLRYDLYLNALRGDPFISSDSAERLRILNNLDLYVATHHADWNNRTLFDHQMSAVESILAGLEQGIDKGYVQLPTGFGKTVIFSELVEAMQTKSLIVVPSQKLLTQTVDKLEKFAKDLDVGQVYAKSKKFGNDATVITYDSLIIGIENGTINPAEYGLLILDEVHESLTDRRIETVNKFDKSIVLGFTATPAYDEEKKTENLLPHKYHEVSVVEAVEMGALSNFTVILAELDIDISNVRVLSNGEFDQEELAKAINFDAISKATIELYKKLFKGQLGVIFNSRIDFSEKMAETLTRADIHTASINSSLSPKEEDTIYKMIDKGEIDIFTGVKGISRGLDIPAISFGMNQFPTTSQVSLLQKFGRILRVDENNPNKEAVFIEFLYKDKNGRRGLSLVDILGTARAQHRTKKQMTDESEIDIENIQSDVPQQTASLPGISIEGVRVIVDPEEVMRYMNKEMPRPAGTPEGTISVSRFAHTLGLSEHIVLTWLKGYRLHNPSAVGIFESTRYTYLSPQMQSIVYEAFSSFLQSKERIIELKNVGYQALTKSLRTELASSDGIILQKAKELAVQWGHPEWVKSELRGLNATVTYFSPEIIALLKKHFYIAEVPANMISLEEVEAILGVEVTTDRRRQLDDLVSKKLVQNPNLALDMLSIRKRSNGADRHELFYDRDIALALKAKMEEQRLQTHHTINSIIDEFAISNKTLAKILKEIILPEGVMEDDIRSIDLGGSIGRVDAYSDRIINRLREICPAKGWMITEELQAQVPSLAHIPLKRARIHIRNILSSYPHLMKSIGEQRTTTYYSPEAIEILKKYSDD